MPFIPREPRIKFDEGEEGEIFEFPESGMVEKEYRVFNLYEERALKSGKPAGPEIRRKDSPQQIMADYYLYKLANKLFPDNFIEVAGAREKDGKISLFSRKVEISEEDEARRERLKRMLLDSYEGLTSRKDTLKLIKKYDQETKELYPEIGELAESFKRCGLLIPHWQFNFLKDKETGQVRFCEVKAHLAGRAFWQALHSELEKNKEGRTEKMKLAFKFIWHKMLIGLEDYLNPDDYKVLENLMNRIIKLVVLGMTVGNEDIKQSRMIEFIDALANVRASIRNNQEIGRDLLNRGQRLVRHLEVLNEKARSRQMPVNTAGLAKDHFLF